MRTSRPQANSRRRRRPWFRSLHRWLGGIAALFVLLLSVTGIMLNHGHRLGIDQEYIDPGWLTSLYGIEAPLPSDSFATGGHRATLLGETLYFDRSRLMKGVSALNGMTVSEGMFAIAGDRTVILASSDGELVDEIDLNGVLPGPIQRLGLEQGRVMVLAAGQTFVADDMLAGFSPATDENGSGIDWADATPAPADLISDLQDDFLGEALTIERVTIDLHSGRILGPAGAYFMDFIALSLIVLSMTGLFQWRQRRNGNGQGKRKKGR